MDAALTTNAQFGKFYSAEKFINQLGKKPQLRKFLFQGDDAKKLKDLQNTLAFAQGDLSRLPGLPGGIFIQLKQAGANGQILQLGQAGTIGVAGVLGGLVPGYAGILFAPAVASKIMLNPKFSNLIFKEQAKLIAKGENTPSKMGVLYRQIVGRMFTDGLITKEERDDAFSQVDSMQQKLNQEQNAKAQVPLPEVKASNFPVIESAPSNTTASSPQLAQALNLFNKGGIASVRGK